MGQRAKTTKYWEENIRESLQYNKKKKLDFIKI